jgi:hypothetical protein
MADGLFGRGVALLNWTEQIDLDDVATYRRLSVDLASRDLEGDSSLDEVVADVEIVFVSVRGSADADGAIQYLVSRIPSGCTMVVDLPLSQSLGHFPDALRFVPERGLVLFRRDDQRDVAADVAMLLSARVALEIEVTTGQFLSPQMPLWVLVGRGAFTLHLQGDCGLVCAELSKWETEKIGPWCFEGCRGLEAVSLPPGASRGGVGSLHGL